MNKQLQKLGNWIHGQKMAPISSRYLENINPYTQEIINYVPLSSSQDVQHAVQAAKDIFPLWSGTSKYQRAEYLINIANEIERNFDVEYSRHISYISIGICTC